MKISVITVNYNNLKGLETTLNSVFVQTYGQTEYIVIDGDSKDGSKEILEQNDSRITCWISEPDNGIYHAMNKGIKKSTGDYLFFLNSGDTFYKNSVLEEFAKNNPIEDIIYGNVNVVFLSGKSKIKHHNQELNLLSCLTETITHQAMFLKKHLFKDKLYNTDYKLISDWIYYFEQIVLYNKTSKHLDMVIANFETAGLSSNTKLIKQERKEYLIRKFSTHYYDLYELMVNNYDKYKNLKEHKMFGLLVHINKIFRF